MDSQTISLLTLVVAAIGALVVLGLLAWAVSRNRRTRRLRGQFGSEYDRVLQESSSREAAEKVLAARMSHVKSIEIRALTESERDEFARSWRSVQARFIDEPDGALREADQLIKQVMLARGYPVEKFDERAADLSVHYPELVEDYRTLRRIVDHAKDDEIGTEEMRQAILAARSLFERLLEARADEHAYEEVKESVP